MAEGSVTPGSVKYKRVIIKLSGEVLRNERDGEPIDAEILESMCAEIAEIYELGVEIGLVIGGGNYRVCEYSGDCHRRKTCRRIRGMDAISASERQEE